MHTQLEMTLFYTDVKRARERSQTPNHGSAGTQGGGGAGGDGGAGGVGEQLAFLRNNPQFQGLRQVIRPMHLWDPSRTNLPSRTLRTALAPDRGENTLDWDRRLPWTARMTIESSSSLD